MRIFFSGICGSGLSAIACFMAEKGDFVAGSDRAFDKGAARPLYETLRAKGIGIAPQDGSGIEGGFDFAVFSTAVEPENPDFKKAKSLGIPLMTRPEYLIEILSRHLGIAVTGTSGKSTASALIAFLMKRLGLDPNFIGGGRAKQFKTPVNPGNCLSGGSDYLVVEACESDGTIKSYRPLHTAILNLSLDHHTIDKTKEMFREIAKNTRGAVFINADDENLKGIDPVNKITFSISAPSEFRASDLKLNPFGSEFSVGGEKFKLSIPGRYNVYNALSAIAVLSNLSIGLKDIASVICEFEGIERRFDVHLNDGPDNKKRFVIDDYAHNPHKIVSLMEAVSPLAGGICYIFQPHGYGPTRLMREGYIEAFSAGLRGSDHLILLPIFYAGGTASKDISSEELAVEIILRGKSAEAVSSRDEVLRRLAFERYVVMGARDESLADFARAIAGALRASKKTGEA